MKEKIIDFFNGIFTWDQPRLRTDPKEIVFELNPGESAEGSFVVASEDERRIKGLLYTRIPGLTLKGDSFFARAARVEYRYTPGTMREGETLEDVIWLETSAGEYPLPVKVHIKGGAAEEEEDEPLPVVLAKEAELQVYRTGDGQSGKWKERRRKESAIAQIQRVVEEEGRGACTGQEAAERLRKLADILTEAEPESAVYLLLDVWVMLREGRKKEAGWILKKYEKTRLLQSKELSVRAMFLYVNSLFSEDENVTASAVSQLQKIYRSSPENWLITKFLLELDPQLKKNNRTRYQVLERQFRAGTRNRLLYQEAFSLLEKDMALFARLDPFSVQAFGWAASRGLLTMEAADAVAVQATRIRKWSPLAARLLKTCYEIHPSRETAGAVCLIYIRGHRTDAEAFGWYEKGVEREAKITNLYEYFIYALPEDYPRLIPRPVLLYFHYHNTLTGQQKTKVYCNLVRYGTPGDPVLEEHRRLLQEFLLEQLKERRLNDSLAWLYGRCLLAETLEANLLEALADILFLRKITCTEKRIRQVEVHYEQLADPIRVPLTGESACVPVYTADARILLVDEQGNRHQKTVPYEMKRMMIEPQFLQLCMRKLKGHLGLNLYMLDGKERHQAGEDNLSLIWELLEDGRIRESYRQQLKLELLEYELEHNKEEQPDERLLYSDAEVLELPGRTQALYIENLIRMRQDKDALRLLWKSGCRETEAGLLLCLVERLLTEGSAPRNVLRSLAGQAFKKGMYTEQTVALLTEENMGNTAELLELWKAGAQFSLSLPELEEQIVVQALFTEQYVCEVFPVFLSMDDRGGRSVIGGAYLNYISWLDFVKGKEVPEDVFDCLEQHLLWEDRFSDTMVLAYLRHLSVLVLLSDGQKRLAGRLLRELPSKNRQFAFMKTLSCYMGEKGRPSDYTTVEYRCNPKHKVILHYVLEYHGKKSFDYVTERLYPVCGGIFIRPFILFYGERLTWFVTETAEDGTESSTECRTVENREEHEEGTSRYSRLCCMQRALDHRQERTLKRMMADYEELTELTEEKFCVR